MVSPPVEDLLITLLASRWDARALEAARALATAPRRGSPPPAWDAVVALAERSRLAPLAYRATEGRIPVPAEVREAFRRGYYRTLTANAIRLEQADAAFSALAELGIDLLLLKGAALVDAVFDGDLGVRPMADVDLLVPRERGAHAQAALEALGFRPWAEELRAGHSLRFGNERLMIGPAPDALPLDLHWAALAPLHYQHVFPDAWLWEHATPARHLGGTARAPAPAALLLHVVAHATVHHGGEATGLELQWESDLCEIVARHGDRIAWPELVHRARQADLVAPTAAALARLRDAWRAPVPAGVLEELRETSSSIRERIVLAAGSARRGRARRALLEVAAHLVSAAPLRRRLGSLFGVLVPDARYMRSYARRHALPGTGVAPLDVAIAHLHRLGRPWIGVPARRRSR